MIGPIALATLRTSVVLGLRLSVQAGTLLLVARLLGPGAYGTFAGISALAVMLGTLSTFGTHLVLLGQMSQDPARRQLVLCYAIPCTLLCGGSLLVLHGLVCELVLNASGVSMAALLLVGIAETVLQPLFLLMVSEHHALGRIARSQLLQMLPMALRLLVAYLVLVVQPVRVLDAYAAGYAAASVLALFCGAFGLPHPWPSWRKWRLPRWVEWRGAVGYAAINISKTGPAELDKMLALRWLPNEAAGVYAASARVVGAVTLPVTAMTLSALPRLFRDGHKRDGGHLLAWMFGAASVYSLVLAGALWWVAPLFGLAFGAGYEGIGEVIRLLCLAVPGLALRLVAGNALMALGKPWMRVGFEVVGLGILIIASSWLVALLGARGMPLALACAEWGMAIAGGVLVLLARGQARATGGNIRKRGD